MKNKGQTLLEVIIATGVVSVALVAIIGIVVQSLVANAESKQRTQATFLAQDAVEKILAIRNVNAKAIKAGQSIDWDLDFYTQDGFYQYPMYIGTDTPLRLNWLSVSQVNDTGGWPIDYTYDGVKFTRYIEIKKRGTAAEQAVQKDVNVRVTWPSSNGTGEVYISTVITKLP